MITVGLHLPFSRKCCLLSALWTLWPQLCVWWQLLWGTCRSSPPELPAWYEHYMTPGGFWVTGLTEWWLLVVDPCILPAVAHQAWSSDVSRVMYDVTCPCSVIGWAQGHCGGKGGAYSGPRSRWVCGPSPSPFLLLHLLLIHTTSDMPVTHTLIHSHRVSQCCVCAAVCTGQWVSCFFDYCARTLGDSVIPLPHIYGARIKGVEVFCPLDPPPPYEAVAGSSTNTGTQVNSDHHLSQ